MTKKKSTKRALISSLLVLAMCFTMLAGTTFAWFTDSVESGVNTIVSGKLAVGVQYLDANGDWQDLTAGTKLFKEDALFEPGYVDVAYIKVINKGTLALKYGLTANIGNEQAGTNKAGESFKLSDYLMLGTAETTAAYATRAEAVAAATNAALLKNFVATDAGHLDEANDESGIIALVLYMPETVGNEANYKDDAQPSIEIGITVLATQYTYEADSFNDQYDVAAAADFTAATQAQLTTAIADAQDGDVIALTDDIALTQQLVVDKDVTINLNGNDITSNGRAILADDGAKVTIDGDGKISSGDVAIQANDGSEIVINGGEVEAQEVAVMAFSGSTITINGGEFKAIDNFVFGTNGSDGYGANTIVINDGHFIGGIQTAGYVACGIYVANNDTVIVNGGTFDITDGCGILARSGNTTVNGGTFNVTGDGHLGKVGDSQVVVPSGEVLVLDLQSNYPGGAPTLTNNTTHSVYTIQ